MKMMKMMNGANEDRTIDPGQEDYYADMWRENNPDQSIDYVLTQLNICRPCDGG